MIRLVVYAAGVQSLVLGLLSVLVMWMNAPSTQQLTIRDGLHTLFTDQDCHFDCLMGIRAGRNFPTPLDEAVAILESHPWVDAVNTHAVSRRTTWTWSGMQPPVVDGSQEGLLIPSKLYEENISRVGIMQIPIKATLHDMVIVYGQPDSSRFGYDPDFHPFATHYASYRDLRIQLSSDLLDLRCPFTPVQVAEAPAILSYGTLVNPLFAYEDAEAVFPYYDPAWLWNAPFCR